MGILCPHSIRICRLWFLVPFSLVYKQFCVSFTLTAGTLSIKAYTLQILFYFETARNILWNSCLSLKTFAALKFEPTINRGAWSYFSQLRPIPTKWETSRKISFESYWQILDVPTLSFKMIYNMLGLLPYLGSTTHYFLEKFLCFLLIFEMFNEPYLL